RRPARSAPGPPRSPRGRSRLPGSERCDGRVSLEAGRAAAAHTVAPAHVHLTAARRTAQLSRRRLPALGAEVHLAAAGECLAAVGTLAWRLALLGELERRAGERRLLRPIVLPIGDLARFGRWHQRGGRRRRVRPVAP